MQRELLILRHGEAEFPRQGKDFDRPLTDYGKRCAQRVGSWLQQQQLLPDYVIASSAQRAAVTAEKTCKAMGIGAASIVLAEQIYLAEKSTLMRTLQQLPADSRRVLLVGHNPGLEALLTGLSGTPAQLSPASLAHLTVDSSWQELADGRAQCAKLIHAEELPQGFPFDTSGGREWRDRPAYYYSQSSVIPYRRTDSGLQVLMVGSSKVKHWVVPKGIQEPGMSPQASAAKEALEEAGVEGEVASEPLGQYSYRKWGAECIVRVYPMQVTRMLSDTQWQEAHRGRHWVTPEQAAKWLKQKAVRRMMKQLVARLERA